MKLAGSTFATTLLLLELAAACDGARTTTQALEADDGDEPIDPGFGEPDDPCDGLDNDHDGVVDEGCYCEPGQVQACYPGAPDDVGVGACSAGLQACVDPRGDFRLGRWGDCEGAQLPSAEICGNAVDEDCDGYAAPCQDGDVTGLPCHPGETAFCYPGPAGTDGVGICTGGTRACGDGDLWGACEGAVTPRTEICDNGVDEDCDGHDTRC